MSHPGLEAAATLTPGISEPHLGAGVAAERALRRDYSVVVEMSIPVSVAVGCPRCCHSDAV
jgi:hypothetical protein